MKIKSQIESPIYKDKNGNNVYGTRKLLGFFIIDSKKHGKIKSSADIVVNLECKIGVIVNNWFKDTAISVDIIKLLMQFLGVGDAEFMKDKTDEYSRCRYLYGREIMQYGNEVRRARRWEMKGRRD